MPDRPLTIEEIVERTAWKLCAMENEVWDEAPQSYRDRWRREAAQKMALVTSAGLSALKDHPHV